MAPIVPAGKRKFDWAPDLETLSKKAEGDEEVMTGDTDELDQFEAIKDLPGIKDSAEELEEAVAAVEDAAAAAQKAVEVVKEIADKETPAEEKAEHAEGGEEEITEIIPGVEEKVCAEKPIGEASVILDVVPEAGEVPPGVKEDGKSEVEKEGCKAAVAPAKTVEAKKADKDPTKEKPAATEGDAKEKAPAQAKKEGKWASDSQKFVRMSALTPQNRKELVSYWTALGFPAEYVQAMVKDYEE